ncbi:MAG: peptidylprolyl isomerase [bacterium]|nr:peptidylprolyl isomerase [bacterium]
MKITGDRVVSMHYTLKDDSGEVLDSSERGEEPLQYLHGHGQIIPGLEKALDGMSEGDKVELTVSAEDGYGDHDPERVMRVPRSKFEFAVDPGEVVEAQHASGQSHNFLVVEVNDKEIVLDGNHPLAGKTLNFSVEVAAVRDATEKELKHAAKENGPAH